MNKQEIKLFESFLAGKLAFTKFVDNVMKFRNLEGLYATEYEEVILGAFDWDASPEGQEYWEDLSDAWIEYTRNIN